MTRTRLLVWAAVLVFVCATAALPRSANGQPDHPSEVLPAQRWPSSVKAAVADILGKMKEEDKAKVRETKQADLDQFHHGWGTTIRNYYGLWRGNQALILSACGKPCHPEEASVVIIEAAWKALQAK